MCHERTCPRRIWAQAVKRTEELFRAGTSPRLFLPYSDIFVLLFPWRDASFVLVGQCTPHIQCLLTSIEANVGKFARRLQWGLSSRQIIVWIAAYALALQTVLAPLLAAHIQARRVDGAPLFARPRRRFSCLHRQSRWQQ